MARDDLHFRLRLPEELKQRVQDAAEQNHRSMTAEIVARLEASFSAPLTATMNFDAYAESLMKMTAAEIAIRSMQATVAMAEALEGKSDAERKRVMMDAIDVVQRDHLDKLASGLTQPPPRMPQPHDLPDAADDEVRRIAARIRAEVERRQQTHATQPKDPPIEEVLDQVRRILRTDAGRGQASVNEKKAG